MEGILSLSLEELIVLAILAFLLLKPGEYQSIGRWAGRMLRQFVGSDGWKAAQTMMKNMQQLPSQLMRESAREDFNPLEEFMKTSYAPRPPASPSPRSPFPPPAGSPPKNSDEPAPEKNANDE